jgi:cytochrome c
MRAVFALALGLGVVSSGAAFAQDPPHPGQAVFNQCRACHQVGPTARNGVGPQLNGLFGRKAGSVAGYNYSDAYKSLDKVWSPENFTTYIQDPRGVTPGTKMVFAGIKGEGAEQKIKDLIGFLSQYQADGSIKK